MSKELNYPVKYAVLELSVKRGWSTGYSDIIQGYIVSKCYVVEGKTVYKADGTFENTYKVVFPYTGIYHFKKALTKNNNYIGTRTVPNYNICNMPYPIDTVNELYDSYEEAKIEAMKMNDYHKSDLKLQASMYSAGSSIREKMERELFEFDDNLMISLAFEKLVLEATTDMEVTETQVPKVFKKKRS